MSDQAIVTLADQPVRAKRLVSVTQHDLTERQFYGTLPANCNHVSRPHRGQHAGSRHPQTYLAELTNDLRRQFAFGGVLDLWCRIHRLRSLPVAMATRLCGVHLAAAQRARLKEAFLAKCRFLVGFPVRAFILCRCRTPGGLFRLAHSDLVSL